MAARPGILLLCAAVAATPRGLLAQPTVPPPIPKRPSVQLTMDEVNALMTRLRACWALPVGMRTAPGVVVSLRINLKPDGSLAGTPVVVNTSQDPLFPTLAQSAIRAVVKCAPYGFLPAAKYAAWKEVEASFDPREPAPRDKTK